ncbi:MAG: hypothetical protein WCT85_04970 [Parachlamydiales bacterium]|jgi:hypothetical protein
MATAKHFNDKEKMYHLIEKLDDEFRWCVKHPNDVSKIELEQLKQAVDELDDKCKLIGGNFYRNYLKFKRDFDRLATHINEIKFGDYQKFDDMIQQFFRDLK